MNLERPRFETLRGHFGGPPDLAHVEPFDIGDVHIIPAERRIEAPDGSETVLEPLVMQVLVVLAEAQGRILSRDDLVNACWGRRIVGDDAVNRVMSRLRRGLSATCGDRLRITTISKVGYRLDVGPKVGAAHDAPVSDQSNRPARGRSRVAAVAIAIVGVAGVGAAAMLVPSPAAGVAIAIEPAAGSATDTTTTAFASDLTTDIAELTGSMTRLTLVEPDAATNADMTLQVAYRSGATDEGARVRLIDVSNGAVIWSRVFDSRDTSQAVVRERAAHAIAGVVRCGLDRSAGDLGDPVSKRLYFSACDAVQVRDWPRARSYARQIVDRRPNSGASWACLAMTTAHAAQGNPAERERGARQAMEYARKALALDPHSGLAHQSLAVALEMQGQSGMAAIEDGVAMDPEHSGLLARYAFGLFDMGYVSAALDPALRSFALDPGDYSMATTAFYILLGSGKRAEARDLESKIERIWGRDRDVGSLRSNLSFYAAKPVAALADYDAHPIPDPAISQVVRSELAWRTDPADFDWRAFDDMADRVYSADASMAWSLAFAAIRMKDRDRALAWLDRSHGTLAEQDWYLLFWPEAAELRRDPRFFAKMAEVGLVAEWQRRGRWPDFCRERGLQYDCKREAARLSPAVTT